MFSQFLPYLSAGFYPYFHMKMMMARIKMYARKTGDCCTSRRGHMSMTEVTQSSECTKKLKETQAPLFYYFIRGKETGTKLGLLICAHSPVSAFIYQWNVHKSHATFGLEPIKTRKSKYLYSVLWNLQANWSRLRLNYQCESILICWNQHEERVRARVTKRLWWIWDQIVHWNVSKEDVI